MPLLIPKYGGLITNTNGMEYTFRVSVFVNEDWVLESEGTTKELLCWCPVELRQMIFISCNGKCEYKYLNPLGSKPNSKFNHQVSDYSDLIPSESYNSTQDFNTHFQNIVFP